LQFQKAKLLEMELAIRLSPHNYLCKIIWQMKHLAQTVGIILCMACNNSNNKSSSSIKTHTDSVMAEVMHAHNLGMAKMDKISEVQARVQQAIDSIAKLSPALQKQSATYKKQLDSLLTRLKYADDAMNKWMDEFNMDSEANNSERRIKYLESEKTKILNVNDTMLNSIRGAESLLRKKF
jgi:SMC interacting uncharacterized protein involved in chromosome segregation